MKAEEMNQIFDDCIADYHQKDDVKTPLKNPFEKDIFQALLYQKCWIDTVQWHLEDIIRDPEINPKKALQIKRKIDASNQDRTDLVEQIDDYYLSLFQDVKLKNDARLNTESPAWAIDRLSILALKIYHMKIEAERTEIEQNQKEKNRHKLSVLLEQRKDLSLAINQLLDDLHNGNRKMKTYRQMKMYNDPALNPVLYSSQKKN